MDKNPRSKDPGGLWGSHSLFLCHLSSERQAAPGLEGCTGSKSNRSHLLCVGNHGSQALSGRRNRFLHTISCTRSLSRSLYHPTPFRFCLDNGKLLLTLICHYWATRQRYPTILSEIWDDQCSSQGSPLKTEPVDWEREREKEKGGGERGRKRDE